MVVITELREDEEEAAVTAPKAVAGRSDEEVLAAVLARKGGPLPFLQAAIDVARRRSGLFRDPYAAGMVATMAEEAQAKAEAEERQKTAKGEARRAAETLKEEDPRTLGREAGRAWEAERVRGGSGLVFSTF
ncbi:hypothetical protein E2562_031262 [Oryza meyeriana var. granulata]|uniref:Uncharacterized protein n=1 Tax=Oryza meyeriana var. granulata TaxID=110450 RepID=A0A6G1FEL6_9ORYZ|nr:hypothetical protein E2562_031262 [Oryza meyeriana var. granulata]